VAPPPRGPSAAPASTRTAPPASIPRLAAHPALIVGVSTTVPDGWLAVIGPNGAGKSTLLDGGRPVAQGSPDEVLTAERIARHYEAHVTVVDTGGGSQAVLPVRWGAQPPDAPPPDAPPPDAPLPDAPATAGLPPSAAGSSRPRRASSR
jgi:hypothetical protein